MVDPVKVLFVDDSSFMRRAISSMLNSDSNIHVIGEAVDGEDAIQKIKTLVPDIVTLDVEMPRMNGLEALKIIMKEMPLPVIMVSSMTEDGARETMKALEYGAVDYIPKNLSGNIVNIITIKNELIEKVKLLGSSKRKIKRIFNNDMAITLPDYYFSPDKSKIDIVVIGSSTGGPKALQDVVPKLPKNFPAGILIVQHMLPVFTAAFAEKMREVSQIEVREAKNGDKIKKGVALVAPGGFHLRVRRWQGDDAYIKLSKEPPMLHMPSVDIVMESIARGFSGHVLGVIMTGMGRDGREGIKAIKGAGGKTIAQDEETSIIFGMPKAAIDTGLIDKIVPLRKIADEILKML